MVYGSERYQSRTTHEFALASTRAVPPRGSSGAARSSGPWSTLRGGLNFTLTTTRRADIDSARRDHGWWGLRGSCFRTRWRSSYSDTPVCVSSSNGSSAPSGRRGVRETSKRWPSCWRCVKNVGQAPAPTETSLRLSPASSPGCSGSRRSSPNRGSAGRCTRGRRSPGSSRVALRPSRSPGPRSATP